MVAQISITVHLIFIYYLVLLYIFIIIDREVGAPGHVKYFYGLNDRYKLILKLAVKKLLNPEIIHYDHIFKFMEVH